MKKIAILLFLVILFSAHFSGAQIFWTENFGSSGVSGTLVTSYSGPNGPWGQTSTGTESPAANLWFVSCDEAGHTPGGCGTDCAGGGPTGIGPSLHVGPSPLSLAGADGGAHYDAGGFCPALYCVTTAKRAESPVINCTGRYSITLRFFYIMDGQAGSDYANVWYYDGTTWSLLASPGTTPPICPPIGGVVQGLWTTYSVALPPSANNNANVKIGFNWVNNDDGVGTDPSFAVDSISLSGSTSSTTTSSFTTSSTSTCQDSCITFTSTSTGTIDSFTWSMAGVTIATPHTSPVTVCFSVAAVYTMTLTTWHSGTSYTSTHSVTINPAPAPITGSHVVCVGNADTLADATPSGLWSSSTPSVATVTPFGIVTGVSVGTATITYTLSTSCYTTYTVTVTPLPCTTGIEPAVTRATLGLEIFPNPATNELFIRNCAGTYTITNDIGQTLLSGTLSSTGFQTQINISSLPSGLYYIRLSGSSQRIVRKFVKS